jgi:anti-anti-sigma regulatory factor
MLLAMVLVTSNQPQQVLSLRYVERVLPADLDGVREDLKALVGELTPGFRLFVDLSLLEYMDPECLTEMGRTMELLDQRGVGLIVRVIPDPAKDIGLSILTIFHYPHNPRVITCQSVIEGLRQLALWR